MYYPAVVKLYNYACMYVIAAIQTLIISMYGGNSGKQSDPCKQYNYHSL